jgi:hypothetical protein
VVAVVIGASLTKLWDEHVLLIALGAVLIALSGFFLLYPGRRLAATPAQAITGGAVSGYIAGLTGTGGAVRGMALAAFDLGKEAFVATSAWIDMGVDLSRTVVYASNGFIGAGILLQLPVLAGVSWLGSWLGKALLARVPQERFRRIVLELILLVGVLTLAQALRARS